MRRKSGSMAHVHHEHVFATEELLLCRQDAEAFVNKYCDFYDYLWSTNDEWDYEVLRTIYAEDVQIGWQGVWSTGMKKCFIQWKPIKNSIVHSKHLSFEVHTFSETV